MSVAWVKHLSSSVCASCTCLRVCLQCLKPPNFHGDSPFDITSKGQRSQGQKVQKNMSGRCEFAQDISSAQCLVISIAQQASAADMLVLHCIQMQQVYTMIKCCCCHYSIGWSNTKLHYSMKVCNSMVYGYMELLPIMYLNQVLVSTWKVWKLQ